MIFYIIKYQRTIMASSNIQHAISPVKISAEETQSLFEYTRRAHASFMEEGDIEGARGAMKLDSDLLGGRSSFAEKLLEIINLCNAIRLHYEKLSKRPIYFTKGTFLRLKPNRPNNKYHAAAWDRVHTNVKFNTVRVVCENHHTNDIYVKAFTEGKNKDIWMPAYQECFYLC